MLINTQNEPLIGFAHLSNTLEDFNLGTRNKTIFNISNSRFELDSTGKTTKSGDYTSPIIDSKYERTWESITVGSTDKYHQALPDSLGSVDTGSAGIINMTGNVYLAHMNDTSNSIADSSGNSITGTSYNSTSVDGYFGKAQRFNGTKAYIAVPNSPSLNPTQFITLEAWVKWNADPTTKPGWAQILSKNGDNQYQLQHNTTNTFFEFAVSTSVARKWIFSTTVPKMGIWYHVVSTYDGALQKIYVNGVFEAQGSLTGTISTSVAPISIGRRTSSADRYFTGDIDEVAIYNRALSASEILTRYKSGSAKLKAQVRNCTTSDCSGSSFVGADGNVGTYFDSFPLNNINLNPLIKSRYFQYKLFFETGVSTYTPQLSAVLVSASSTLQYETTTQNSCFDLTGLTAGGVVDKIPFDPLYGSSRNTAYGVRKLGSTLQLYACRTEDNAFIFNEIIH